MTVLFPFVPPEQITPRVISALQDLFAVYGPFEFALRRVDTFPGVLFLPPDPAEPFKALTHAVHQRWPENPPYEGMFDSVVPHLTVGMEMPEDDEQHVADALERQLPISAFASRVELFVEHERRWSPVERFALGIAASDGSPATTDAR